MVRSVSMVALLVVVVGAGCSLGEIGLPSEVDALSRLDEAEVVARALVVDAFGVEAVSEWEHEFFDDACTMTCQACDQTNSRMELVGGFSLDELMVTMAEAAMSAGGSAGEIELFGETHAMYVKVEGDRHEHRVRVALDD